MRRPDFDVIVYYTIRATDYTIGTANVTVYANTTVIARQTITITNRNSTTVTFTWNTIGFDRGVYTITATADRVQYEIDITDNTYTNGLVLVTKVGDVDGNGWTNVIDIILCCINMG